ncbi:MAG: acetyl-CoA decarbonylase/synthase complex subunit delta [Coriobacteriia bacterium]|nr:acetyl-CoA decarbonylase/synthase complex subunit delta [Coriobacteriia bacterium]
MQKEEDSAPAQSAAKTEKAAAADNAAAPEPAEASGAALSSADIETLKEQLATEVRASVTAEVVSSIIDVLSQRFLGKAADLGDFGAAAAPAAAAGSSAPAGAAVPKAADVIAQIKSFPVETETLEESILEVKLGATKEEGGTRGLTYTVGGSNCMPFHLYEGKMPHRPLIAMEVFDTVSEKYPDVLREIYGDLLNDPAAMAQACVSNYGADMISVRLDGTHPEKGGRTPQQAVDLVGEVLKAVDVPLIVTGHSHYDSNNEVFKAIAQTYEGENLLLNWVEQDNYRTIAGAAMAYGHTLVSQAPIDVNISKQMNILLTNMGLPQNRIIMDPLTSSIGYGVEYTYSVMERIRLTGLGGDKMLCSPMLVTPGFESAKAKEFKAPEADYPLWGDVKKRSAIWELTTAISLLHAGADILVMYHPEAAKATKETIFDLLDGQAK